MFEVGLRVGSELKDGDRLAVRGQGCNPNCVGHHPGGVLYGIGGVGYGHLGGWVTILEVVLEASTTASLV